MAKDPERSSTQSKEDGVMTVPRDPVMVLDERAGPPTRTEAYGPHPAQVYDVRLPTRRIHRLVVVVVHGGFWRQEYDRGHASRQAQAFADAGYATAVIEYRRPGMPGGGWPGTPDDVAAAVAAVRKDPDFQGHVALVGHSAGGQLVAWAAAEPWAHGLAGVLSLAGVLDLGGGHETFVGSGAIEAFLGGTPASVPAHYAAADPIGRPPGIPIVLLHGDDDQEVPLEQSERYAARHHGALVRLRVVPGCGHYGLIDPEHPAFAEVLAALDLLGS
jgi:acetyl esterase/lipase